MLGLGELEDCSREAQKVIAACGPGGTGGCGLSSIAASGLLLEAYVVRGDALHGLGITDQAQKYFAAALQLDPDNQEVGRKLKTLRRVVTETARLRGDDHPTILLSSPLIPYHDQYPLLITTIPFTSLTGEIDKAMVSRKFEAVIGFCTEGLTIDKDSKKLMTEVTPLVLTIIMIYTFTNRVFFSSMIDASQACKGLPIDGQASAATRAVSTIIVIGQTFLGNEWYYSG